MICLPCDFKILWQSLIRVIPAKQATTLAETDCRNPFRYSSPWSKGTVFLSIFKIKEFNIGVILDELVIINAVQRFIFTNVFSNILERLRNSCRNTSVKRKHNSSFEMWWIVYFIFFFFDNIKAEIWVIRQEWKHDNNGGPKSTYHTGNV